jgi:glycosyltransferase involved in cell wall biosynthesis
MKDTDEIVVQLDSTNVTNEVRIVADSYKDKIPFYKVIEFPLNKDFASFKNNLTKHCSKEWIFNIDADEMPSGDLMEFIHEVLSVNNDVDVIFVPRWNAVEGITEEHIQRWGWRIDEFSRVNWPDYQMRLYKNKPEIKWVNKVHEHLDGYSKYSALPSEREYCLFHNKTIERQEKQNEFYSEIN